MYVYGLRRRDAETETRDLAGKLGTFTMADSRRGSYGWWPSAACMTHVNIHETVQHTASCFYNGDIFFKGGNLVTWIQWWLCLHFNEGLYGKVPSRNTILFCVNSFGSTGSALKKKPAGCVWNVWIPENIEALGGQYWKFCVIPHQSKTL